jgi:hypothetical protein
VWVARRNSMVILTLIWYYREGVGFGFAPGFMLYLLYGRGPVTTILTQKKNKKEKPHGTAQVWHHESDESRAARCTSHVLIPI